MTLRSDINELTTQLSRALDHNYDVIHMDSVMTVISTLEVTHITKEQLEYTRLAKYINQLRRRTKNDTLARRAKTLLKKWREMLGIQQVQNDLALPSQKSDNTTDLNRKCVLLPQSDKFNLITQDGFSNLCLEHSNTSSKRNFSKIHILDKESRFNTERNSINDSVMIDHFSNSSLEEKSNLRTNNDPIIIDIQDSDSESNLKDGDADLVKGPEPKNKLQFFKNNYEHIKVFPSDNSGKQVMDKSFELHSIGTISEMLALSNSSTCNFVSIDLEKNDTTKCDLSFAGKFQNVKCNNSKSNNENDDIIEPLNAYLEDNGSIAELDISQHKDSNNIKEDNTPNVAKSDRSICLQSSLGNKIPKKRGRKRGSRGIDSMIALETGFSSQMLINSINSSNKKVKTTKELFAEMQNRRSSVEKLNIPNVSNSNIFPALIDCDSGNDDSNSISNNSDKSRPSVASNTEHIFVETSSESQFQNFSHDVNLTQNLHYDISILNSELLRLLNTIGPAPSINQIEENFNSTEVKCSCHILNNDSDFCLSPKNLNSDSKCKDMGFLLSQDQLAESNEDKIDYVKVEHNDLLEKSCSEKVSDGIKTKSIFDLDFEEDEDPLIEIRAKVAATFNKDKFIKNENQHIEQLIHQSCDLPTETNITYSSIEQIEVKAEENLLFPKYKIQEDPFCLAKDHYQKRIDKITHFHIDMLHNVFIENINGNWDQSNISNSKSKLVSDENLNDVVPKYGSLEGEILKKNFSTLSKTIIGTRIYNKKECIPFLGVAFPLYKIIEFYREPEYSKVEPFNECNYASVCPKIIKSETLSKKAFLNLESNMYQEFNDFECLQFEKSNNCINNGTRMLRNCVDSKNNVESLDRVKRQNHIVFKCSRINETELNDIENSDQFEASRRISYSSSSDSNSSNNSLKLTQQSINLKKKRRRKDNGQLEKKMKLRRKRQKSKILNNSFLGKRSKICFNEDLVSRSDESIVGGKALYNEKLVPKNPSSLEKPEFPFTYKKCQYNIENEENISPSVSNDGYFPDKCLNSIGDEQESSKKKISLQQNHLLLSITNGEANEVSGNKLDGKKVLESTDENLGQGRQFAVINITHCKCYERRKELNRNKIGKSNFNSGKTLEKLESNKLKNSRISELFHPEELTVTSRDGFHSEYILNVSNCNSSCDEEVCCEETKVVKACYKNQKIEIPDKSDYKELITHISHMKHTDDMNQSFGHFEYNKSNSTLSLENNGVLVSFNNVSCPSINSNLTELRRLQQKLCSVDGIDHISMQNISLKKSNLDKNDTESLQKCEHINENDARIVTEPTFKEWHQVLQLRSYNEELLTVLPYVVLE